MHYTLATHTVYHIIYVIKGSFVVWHNCTATHDLKNEEKNEDETVPPCYNTTDGLKPP